MTEKKHGIPKKRLPEELKERKEEGLFRSGRVDKTYGDTFWVDIKNHGPYKFDKTDTKIFNMPMGGRKVYVKFFGTEEKQYFPCEVIDKISQRVYYERK
jgi:hypothetical protein